MQGLHSNSNDYIRCSNLSVSTKIIDHKCKQILPPPLHSIYMAFSIHTLIDHFHHFLFQYDFALIGMSNKGRRVFRHIKVFNLVTINNFFHLL